MKKLFYFAIVAATFAMTACVAKFDKNVTETTDSIDSIPWYEDMEALDADLKAAIDDVVKAKGLAYVFEKTVILSIGDSGSIDITPDVKAKLGL